jgi:NTE family protein
MNTNFLHTFLTLTILLLTGISTSFAQETSRRPKVGVVLSGGGAKGLAHIGFLKVMEEAGIRPDYIGGTSMGSIIGGLYAMGYSADSLESIAKSMRWSYYLSDEIPRRNLTLEEKADNDRFLLTFPVRKNKIIIPSGIVNGQNIENKLNSLSAPVFHIRNFDELQIPFLCVATDIETGKEVVFREGYLPDALRASMGIPSIFNPIEINNKLLVDGGVVNNFPVNHVKDMGADIIIGVDVGFQFHSKEELNSIIRIIEQTSLFLGHEMNEKNKNITDILITPAIRNYSASSFNATDTLIALGEIAAREKFPELKALADSLRTLDPEYRPNQVLPELDSILINEIEIDGLNKVSAKLLAGKLQMEVLKRYTAEDIVRAVERGYSSLYFEKIAWQLSTLERGGSRLNINIEEKTGGIFRVGLHYDSNYKSAILLNTTFRNVLLDGSKFSANISLGENPYLNLNYFKNNGWKPGFGINSELNNFDVYIYNNEGRRISNLGYTEGNIQLFTQSIIRNSHAIGLGTELERTILKPRIAPGLDFDQSRQSFINYFGFVELDSYEKAFFPKHGMKMYSEFRIVTRKDFDPVLFYTGRISKAVRLSPRGALLFHAYGGFARGDSIPYQYYFYTGGLNPVRRNGMIPFVGLDFMERADKNALIIRADLQIEVFRNFYITAKVNAGNLKEEFNQLFTYNKMIGGVGLTFSYDSWIGPIEYTLMKSTNRPGGLSFVNIGYWF